VKNVKVVKADATSTLLFKINEKKFSKIIADLPCSAE
jgi:16S rRNA C967 or C1407 C5-methylase (RsmB/RsmF family)